MEHGWIPGVSVEDLAAHESLDEVCSGIHEAWSLFGNDKSVFSVNELMFPEQ